MKLVTAGGLRLDTLITQTGEAHVELLGGNALYAAVGAALWTQPVHLWARAGQNYPLRQLQEASGAHITLDGLVHLPQPQDHRTFFAYLPDARRQDTNPAEHFARIGRPLPDMLRDYVHSTPQQDDPHHYEPLALRPADWPESFRDVTAVHLSPLPLATHRHVPARLRAAGVRQITLDPGERYMIPERLPYIQRLLPQVDAFLPSAMEIRSLFGEEADLAETAVTLCRWGAPLVIIKNGAQGVLIQPGIDNEPIHLPAYHESGDGHIVDETGAGDSFCGGFMVGLAQTGDPVQAAMWGIISASLVIEGYGALYALSRLPEAMTRLQERQDRQTDS